MTTGKRIFIVDDDPFINSMVIQKLTSEGYLVEAFENGDDCLKALKKKPDLIILDYFFVSGSKELMNGMEVFEKIKALSPATPVIMLSGQGKGEIVLELARKGIDDYVIKDNNLIDNLSVAINEHFRQK
jgi:two-component system response regulator HydG